MLNINKLIKYTLILVILTSCFNANASEYFKKGSFSLNIGAGSNSLGNSDYIILRVNAGMFILDGLQVKAGLSQWIGDNPAITTVTPGIEYCFHFVPTIKPYVGTFYRRWLIWDNNKDLNALGGRAGFYYKTEGSRLIIAFGMVHEEIIDECTGSSCSNTYPEILASFSF